MAAAELVLYGDVRYTSPWVLSVWTALREKGLAFRMATLDLQTGENRRDDYAHATLTGKVPALRHGDHWIAESLAILEYLEEAFPDRLPLLPSEPFARARDRQILSWLRSDLFELRRCMPFEGIFLPLPPPPLTSQARAEANRLLAVVAHRLGGAPAARPTLADFDLAFTLRRLVHYGFALGGYEAVVAFAEAIWRRPAVQAWVSQPRPVAAS